MKVKVSPIITERLRLKEMTIEDAEEIVRLRGNPQVYQFFSSPHAITLCEHLEWFSNQYSADNNRYDWIAFLADEAIGVFAAKRNNRNNFEAEINYWLKPDKWGFGYAKEAVNGLLRWAVSFWNIKIVTATIHCDNTSSRSFVEKMGFVPEQREGDFVVYRKKL